MIPSQNLFDLLESFERLELEAYQDQHGTWTIGYGSTYYPDGSRIEQGDTCTKEQAQTCLLAHLQPISSHISAILPNLSQCQFDAIIDFTYNEGQTAFDTSTLRKTIAADPNDFANIYTDFMMFNKIRENGVLVQSDGLERRRECEAYLYQHGENAPNFYL